MEATFMEVWMMCHTHPNNDMIFSAYSVFAGGWPSGVEFYPQRSSGIVWWFK
jgi:hypothetical protein